MRIEAQPGVRVGRRKSATPLNFTLGLTMNLEFLLQASIYRADLEIVDSHFGSIGITDLTGMLHLKFALVTLANFCDFELGGFHFQPHHVR